MEFRSLVKCLRHCSEDKNSCKECGRFTKNVGSMRCVDRLLIDAADAIDTLLDNEEVRNEALCSIRRNWQAAEMKICTMCGKFLHGETDANKGNVVIATDGNDIVSGTMTCGELIGYPCCGKFTPWISVSERLPELMMNTFDNGNGERLTCESSDFVLGFDKNKTFQIVSYERGPLYQGWRDWRCRDYKITHWMPLPKPPVEDMHG